ncbi:Ldh family oxidoreductase [Hydrogenophaga sp. BPS33]|uniref:Ldh family oxidoreductase n=1 Tax=Hydrogenophaga sp. BPS33 TaxID=2651974 RepID=UPI00131F6DBE|nr:Ldh family oxidoreductase [Hydrogenophaga sp. BPS33]QHE89074.1 Ldh family oxidoreductase [Hydrogenophaga sp. BPS33]
MSMISIAELQLLADAALRAAGASPLQAGATARALVAADAQGLASHGVSRVAMYAGHLRAGRVDGDATPSVRAGRGASVLVDADDGFAFPACELAIGEAIQRARQEGIAIAGVCNSHHFGAAAYHLEAVARAGLVGLAMGNSPAAMPVAGGARALLGTNPLAAVFPRQGAAPLVIDLSLSEVARGKIMVAASKGEPIPLGWALDAHGQPTTDAAAALQGSMLPFGSAGGGVKGGMLALMVELLVISLTGARFGAEADSFFEAEGNRPRIGQLFIAIDPAGMAGMPVYQARLEALVAAMQAEAGVRLPGARRERLAAQAKAEGLNIPSPLLQSLRELAQGH